ncbi:MAG TPA: sugar phosphate nucleotidyltransferase [Gemmatimonadaceae bacterium]
MKRWVVVLAGGVGSRFWPLSTPERPKQMLPLVTDEPMLLEQLKRLKSLASPKRTLILTNASLVAATAKLSKLPKANIIAEPKPAGTAAALAWAAHLIKQRDGADATMISVHADWAIGNPVGFRQSLEMAAVAAEKETALVTVGVIPSRPDPGFGYIEPGTHVSSGARKVKRFIEKPTREKAVELRVSGFLWNSGIFAWRVGVFLDELKTHSPEVGPALANNGRSMSGFFGAVKKPIAVDHAVLERSKRVLVVPAEFGWDDVGTWGALRRVRPRDSHGNTVHGDAHVQDSTNNVVHAEGTSVVLFGVSDLVVVARDGVTLVTTVEKSADLKKVVETLPPKLKDGSRLSPSGSRPKK